MLIHFDPFDSFDLFTYLPGMNSFLHCNGEILPAATPLVTANNRGLRYGDGLFETIKVINGAMPLLPLHMARMQQGLSLLQMPLPPAYTPAYLSQCIIDLCRQNQVTQAARVRLTVIRGNGTLYNTTDPYATVIIQAEPLAADYLAFNHTGFTTAVYPDVKKSCDILANLKSNNYLPYIMAGMYTKQQQLNDCLLVNTAGRICDGTIANLFWIRNNTIFTPPLSEGCVAGVMRSYLLTQLPAAGYQVEEQPCTQETIQQADEVFLTNALYGIRWVQAVGATQYQSALTKTLYHQFVQPMHQL
jgi:branched-chain amino acid aminotransferase